MSQKTRKPALTKKVVANLKTICGHADAEAAHIYDGTPDQREESIQMEAGVAWLRRLIEAYEAKH